MKNVFKRRKIVEEKVGGMTLKRFFGIEIKVNFVGHHVGFNEEKRIDIFLSSNLNEKLSRTEIQRLIQEQKIKCNERIVEKASEKIRHGDCIVIERQEKEVVDWNKIEKQDLAGSNIMMKNSTFFVFGSPMLFFVTQT